jgi:hypothetical protein
VEGDDLTDFPIGELDRQGFLILSTGTFDTRSSIMPGQVSRLTFEIKSESAMIPTTRRLSSITTTRLWADETSSSKTSSIVADSRTVGTSRVITSPTVA